MNRPHSAALTRAHAPLRMGMLNVLLLVVALCLVVFAILSLATAQAGATLSARQAETVHEMYAVEATAEQFEAQLDELLVAFRESELPPERLMDAVTRGVDGFIGARERLADMPEVGVSITAQALTTAEMHEALGRVFADPALGALKVQFTGPSGHCLDALFALEKDGTYSIMQWKATKPWDQGNQTSSELRASE